MDKNLDELFSQIGECGKYQIYVIVLLSISTIINPIVYISFIFTSMVVKHRCKIPKCESTPPKYSEDWVKYAIPHKKKNDPNDPDEPETCKKFKFVGENFCNKSTFDTSITETCNEFIYAGGEYTLMHEFDLHCENGEFMLSLVGIMVVSGQIPGIVIAGIISDKIGRRKTLVIGSIISGCLGIPKMFLKKFEAFLVVQFLDSLFGTGCFICVFVLASEIVGPTWRSFVGNLMSAVFAFGGLYLCLLWYFIRHWKYLMMVLHGSQFLHILFFWIIPDSIRWDLINERSEKAKKTLRKIAKVNKKELTDDQLDVLQKDAASNENSNYGGHMKVALKSKVLWIRSLICSFCFFTCTFTYYGLTIGSMTLSGKYYLDFCLTIIVEIPSYFLCEVFIRRFGRKKVFSINFAITSVACAIFLFIPKNRWAKLALWLIGKFAITFSFSLVYVYINEMFPTPIRTTYLGISGTMSSFGTASAVLVSPMRQLYENLPLILFAGFTGFSALISIFLPETKGKKLPDTVEEAENLRKAPVII